MVLDLYEREMSFAIVSGKGGSGKTLIATAMALGMAMEGKRVLLVDADFGTGGLTYYLNFNSFNRTAVGFAEYLEEHSFLIEEELAKPTESSVTQSPEIVKIKLLPIGEHRRYASSGTKLNEEAVLSLISEVRMYFDHIIFDCRGGIDNDSLAVCQAVHKVIMIVETDAASIQASQYLTNILDNKGLSNKLAGFILNKVIDDPTSLSHIGKTLFKCDYLGAVPFDIETIRDFIKGVLPASNSLFSTHVHYAMAKVIPGFANLARIKPLTPLEFGSMTLKDKNIKYGALFLASIAIYLAISIAIFTYTDVFHYTRINFDYASEVITVSWMLLFLAGLSDNVKSALGKVFSVYIMFFKSQFFKKNRRK